MKKKSFGFVRLGKRTVVTLGAEVKRELRLVDGDVFGAEPLQQPAEVNA